jgi:hypothetical protein
MRLSASSTLPRLLCALKYFGCSASARSKLSIASGSLERFEDETVVQQDLRRRLARAHGRRDQAQGLGRLPGRKLDQPRYLQGVEVIRPDRENGGVKPFGLGQAPLLVQLERLREGLRNVQRLWFRQRLPTLVSAAVSACPSPCRGVKKAALSRPEHFQAKWEPVRRRKCDQQKSLYDWPAACGTNFSATPFMQ